MKVLISGHEGFIGMHLCRELSEHGYTVEGHDLPDGDLCAPGIFAAHLGSFKPDLVIHLAAQVGRLFGEDDLTHTIASNSTMTALVAYACGQAGIPVLYSSTSEVYGDQGSAVCYEDGPLKLSHNAYGVSKGHGEDWLRLYAPDELKIVRLSMPYGPGAPPGRGRRALDNFLWQAHHGVPITVHHGAERSWCWVGDTVAGIRAVIEKGQPGAYNVGRDDVPLTMHALARKCCVLTGAPFDLIQMVEPPSAQTVVKRLSTEKLRGLGWKPTVELDEGLPRVLSWVEQFDREGQLAPLMSL